MSYLNSIDPEQLAIISTFIAILLSKDKTADQINVLGNVIVSAGGVMLTIAAQTQYLQSIQDKENQVHDLKQQIKDLKND